MIKLNNLNLKNIAESLIDTFLGAGKVAMDIRKKGVKITIKEDKSPVTDGDLAVDEIIRNKLEILTPELKIISEETVNLNIENKHKNFWLVDPIDGTRDYINNKEEFTLNAGLIINLEPALGIIYAPAKDRLFYSYGENCAFEISKNKKSILNCKKLDKEKIIGLENSAKTPEEVLKIYREEKVTQTLKMSSSLKFCTLASGEADIYAATARAYEWDIAAGHAILNHAGGCVSTLEKKKFSYGKKNYKNLSLIAKRSGSLE